MDRKLLLLVAAAAVAAAPGAIPAARADRLGGNFRGPGDSYRVHQDPPAAAESRADQDPLLASLRRDLPFLSGVEAGRKEAEFRGRPLLVFFVLPGCGVCESIAGGAFRDAEVLDLASRFVPVLANAEKEESFGLAHGVRTIPTILLLDAAGLEVARAEGAADPARVAAALREGQKRAGAARPTPAARALERAAALLSRALKAKDWRTLLGTAATIEKTGHDGPEREEARAARREAAREAAARLDAARGQIGDTGRDGARRALAQIARDFEGLEEAIEAGKLLKELESARPVALRFRGGLRPAVGQGPVTIDPRFPAPERVVPLPPQEPDP
jgi:hypothetical protein